MPAREPTLTVAGMILFCYFEVRASLFFSCRPELIDRAASGCPGRWFGSLDWFLGGVGWSGTGVRATV
jgi:hypothetical protein